MGSYIGSVFGQFGGQNCSITHTILTVSVSGQTMLGGFVGFSNQNVTIQNSTSSQNISGKLNQIGGIIGTQMNNVTVIDSLITQTNLSGNSQIGGFVGQLTSTLFITNSKIQSVRISGIIQLGIIVGWSNGGTFTIIGSTSSSNFIKGNAQTNCTLSNTWSASQC
ncbi:filamentous_hemagglutinin N-terminal domain-containing protein [Hexamita inflata]|uniref:Filamentous hemagglutinin N-terminal domain-containing protein n=1 Tax=Hexamita inflata TaxID=28002 RepID=A0AA86UXD1_9EUKA|nr:filamentous hemagglutinin N-terminal domain-containing protein [Hexamita inflata]